jgi:hypothetical protein
VIFSHSTAAHHDGGGVSGHPLGGSGLSSASANLSSISHAFLSIIILFASCIILLKSASLSHTSCFFMFSIRSNTSILYAALSLSLKLRLSTNASNRFKSGTFFTIFHFKYHHRFSDRLNMKLHRIVHRIHPQIHPINAHIAAGSHTNEYLTGSANHLLVSFNLIFAVTHFFTISADSLANSTSCFIPGTISSIIFSVSSSQFNILSFALFLVSLFLSNISFKSFIASDILLYHESILRNSSVHFCLSRNLLNESLIEFSNALLRHCFQCISSFHFSHSLAACASASDSFSNFNSLFMKSSTYFICHSSDGLGFTFFILLTFALTSHVSSSVIISILYQYCFNTVDNSSLSAYS